MFFNMILYWNYEKLLLICEISKLGPFHLLGGKIKISSVEWTKYSIFICSTDEIMVLFAGQTKFLPFVWGGVAIFHRSGGRKYRFHPPSGRNSYFVNRDDEIGPIIPRHPLFLCLAPLFASLSLSFSLVAGHRCNTPRGRQAPASGAAGRAHG